jgi:hypothetical protein
MVVETAMAAATAEPEGRRSAMAAATVALVAAGSGHAVVVEQGVTQATEASEAWRQSTQEPEETGQAGPLEAEAHSTITLQQVAVVWGF